MTSKDDPKIKELAEKLFVPNNCPNMWDWAEFHANGKELHFGTHNRKIITLGNFGCARIEYPRNQFFLPHYKHDSNFARITNLNTKLDQGFVGYFSPSKRRAVFALGQTEPDGLLMFFLWHAWFDQKLAYLPELLDLFILSTKKSIFGKLDFEGFCEIRDLIGKEYNMAINDIDAITSNLLEKHHAILNNIERRIERKVDGSRELCGDHSQQIRVEKDQIEKLFGAVTWDVTAYLWTLNDAIYRSIESCDQLR